MPYNLKKVYQELDQVGVAISVVGTSRQKLMELARLVVPISDSLVGVRPDVKRVRDDLVRLTHNVRRAQLRARPAGKAVRELADKVKETEKLLRRGVGDVPEMFKADSLELVNTWGYGKREVEDFFWALKDTLDVIQKLGVTREVGTGQVFLDPRETPRRAVKYDPFADVFYADPTRARGREEDIARALGARLWVQMFSRQEVDVWGRGSRAWEEFADAFSRWARGKKLEPAEMAQMRDSLGRVVGTDRWQRAV